MSQEEAAERAPAVESGGWWRCECKPWAQVASASRHCKCRAGRLILPLSPLTSCDRARGLPNNPPAP